MLRPIEQHVEDDGTKAEHEREHGAGGLRIDHEAAQTRARR